MWLEDFWNAFYMWLEIHLGCILEALCDISLHTLEIRLGRRMVEYIMCFTVRLGFVCYNFGMSFRMCFG